MYKRVTLGQKNKPLILIFGFYKLVYVDKLVPSTCTYMKHEAKNTHTHGKVKVGATMI